MARTTDGTGAGSGFDHLVIFGDSLSDNGNFFQLGSEFLQPGYGVPFQYDAGGSVRPYANQVFTDGTVYADTFATLLGMEDVYENLAFGGAEAQGTKLGASYINEYANLTYTTLEGGTDTFSIVADTDAALAAYGEFDINLGGQVDRYVDSAMIADGTMAVINIGANDLGRFEINWFEFIFLNQTQTFADGLADAIDSAARQLVGAGVDHITLYTLPSAKLFLAYDAASQLEKEVAKDLIDTVNEAILDRASGLAADGVDTDVVRLDKVSDILVTDAQSHGFLAKGPYLFGYGGDPVWTETAVGIEPVFAVNPAVSDLRADQVMFFDEIHPSGALHDMLGVFSAEVLTSAEVFGGDGDNQITTGSARDLVIAGGGADTVRTNEGADVILGGIGGDNLRSGKASDLVIGGRGADDVRGGRGNDFLTGSLGDDVVKGGGGRDILMGGLGSDVIEGNAGNDIFVFVDEAQLGGSGAVTDVYDGGFGTDVLHLYLTEASAADLTEVIDGETTTLSFGATTLTLTRIEAYEVHDALPGETADWAMPGNLEDRYDEAQLWGVI